MITSIDAFGAPVNDAFCLITKDDRLVGLSCIIRIKPLARGLQNIFCNLLGLLIDTGTSTIGVITKIIQLIRRGHGRVFSECQPQQTHFCIARYRVENGALNVIGIALFIASRLIGGIQKREVFIPGGLYSISPFAHVTNFFHTGIAALTSGRT